MSSRCSAVAVATAATAAVLCLASELLERSPLVASLNDVPLPCQMQIYFVAQLEPTRMRWKSDQVFTTVLKARETDVQECNSAKVQV